MIIKNYNISSLFPKVGRGRQSTRLLGDGDTGLEYEEVRLRQGWREEGSEGVALGGTVPS